MGSHSRNSILFQQTHLLALQLCSLLSPLTMIDPPTSHSVTVNAAEQDHLIDSVTVFQAGRAEVKRRIQLQLQKGQNQITVERLASCLVEDSLRVQGTGTAVIYDVVYHSPKPNPRRGRRQVDNYSSDEEENEEVTECYNAVEALKKQRSVVENQISFLDRYGRSVDGQNSNIESLGHFLDVYGSRRDTLDKKMQELSIKVDRAEKMLRRVTKKNLGRETKGLRRTKITITVMSKEEEGKAELMLAYVVLNASWIPVYDIRASVSSSPSSSSSIALNYRASLTQTTGEDWPEVALTLSTATPYHGADMPTLSTWHIGLPGRGRGMRPRLQETGPMARSRSRSRSPTRIMITREESRRSRSRSRSRSPTRIIQVERRSRSRSRSRSPSRSPTQMVEIRELADHNSRRVISPPPRVIRVGAAPAYSEYEPAPMTTRQADGVDTGVLSATFSIPGRSSIPSDQGNHKCKIINSSEFTFLPGEASIFMGDSFVSKSQIQVGPSTISVDVRSDVLLKHVPPNDSFQLSLGTDPTLRVTYAPLRDHKQKHSQPRFSFPGRQKQPKQTTTKYSQHITIRNTRLVEVSALRILDHVPVSSDSAIKVNVTSPQGLRGEDRPTEDNISEKQYETWVRPQKGVRARWAPPDIGGEGAIEWVCSVDARGELELKLEWEVSAAAGTVWRNW
ncbi:unnamed protein product [Rhizoctonia solani]|uniref:Protein F37C4,5 [Caenorhabditis elegans] n=1 Tax=Rhizoctonia solani TaxID=456999 RepID=A0A8H3B6N6_9AGAM|nr:unnamed protein product [Rhizoctonia solani]